MAVAFDGFSLSGSSPLGGSFYSTDMAGWLSLSMRRGREGRPRQDGNFPSTGDIDGKSITVSGVATYSSPVSAATERRQLLALGGRGLSPLTVVDDAGVLTAMVEVDSLVVTLVHPTMIRFAFALHAPDPLLYGPPTLESTTLAASAGGAGRVWPRVWPRDWGVPPGVTPGAITAANNGTAAYRPRLRIDGPVTNPAVTFVESGDTIRYNATLAADQWLDIDCGLRSVLLNGSVSARYRTSFTGGAFAVPVGGGSLTWTADTADPAATFTVWAYEGAWS